jgi:hypothetical protein
MKKIKILLLVLFSIILLLVLLIATPNSLGERIREEARAQGYLEYSPMQAKQLAETRCTQCHQVDRIAKYCSRCGPPFIVVITHMKRLMAQSMERDPGKKILGLTKPQELVVVQAWNAMVGNWEGDFRREDMVSMIGNDNAHLLALLDTPIEKRKIEHGMKEAGVRLKGTYEEVGTGSAAKPDSAK